MGIKSLGNLGEVSFAAFSRMTPRERMLQGLAGGLAPTFGLEVGAPRAQLGIVGLSGLGLWRPTAAPVDQNQANLNPGVYVQQQGTVVGERAIVTATPTVYAPAPAPSTAFAPQATAVLSPPASVQVGPRATNTSVYEEPPAPPPPEETASEDPNMNPDVRSPEPDEEYTYAEGTPDDTQMDQYTDYESDGNQQDAWGEGGSSWSGGGGGDTVYNRDTYANQTNAIKKPISNTQAAVQRATNTATKYAPWIAGGLALAGVAYFIGRKK